MQARSRAPQASSAAPAAGASTPGRELRLLSLQRLAGNQACLTLQRKVNTKDKSTSKEAELGLPGGKSASPVVRRLLAAPEEYYLPDTPAPDFEAISVRALKASKYILGEAHGDGTWDARTSPWKYVAKMREGLKSFDTQSPEESRAVAAAATPSADMGLPLEDMHAYAMTRLLMTKQVLDVYDKWKSEPKVVEDYLNEVTELIGKYYTVARELKKEVKDPKEGSRQHNLMLVGIASIQHPGIEVLKDVQNGKKAGGALDKEEVSKLQDLLTSNIKVLMELIDTRPMGGGFLGFGQSKQGPDPIPNRAKVDALTDTTGTSVKDTAKALNEGNVVREAAMVKNIKAAKAPLLVQIGDLHVDRITTAVGASAVPVKKGEDFEKLTTES